MADIEEMLKLHDKALQLLAGKLERIELMLLEIRENTRRPGVDYSFLGKDHPQTSVMTAEETADYYRRYPREGSGYPHDD